MTIFPLLKAEGLLQTRLLIETSLLSVFMLFQMASLDSDFAISYQKASAVRGHNRFCS